MLYFYYVLLGLRTNLNKKVGETMPRKNRIKAFSKIYHVIIRGINKQDIFLDKQDYKKFYKELNRVKEKFEFEIYAYALMKNHVHLVIFDKNENLSLMMQSLNISYSIYFNKKYERIGHVFQNRFKSHNIEDEKYLKNVIRYIHKNPEISGLKPYENTSYQEYIDNNCKSIEPQKVLKIFSNNIEFFKNFHDSYITNQDYDKDYEMPGKLQDDEAIEKIKEIVNESNIMKIQNYEVNNKREVLKKIMKIEGITKKQICRILGISKSTIMRIK